MSKKLSYGFKYKGSEFWLFFWILFGFPIAVILLLWNLKITKE